MKEPSRTPTPLAEQYNQIKPIHSLEHEFSGAPGKAGSQKDLIEELLPAPTAIMPERQPRLNRFLNYFDDFSGWLSSDCCPSH